MPSSKKTRQGPLSLHPLTPEQVIKALASPKTSTSKSRTAKKKSAKKQAKKS